MSKTAVSPSICEASPVRGILFLITGIFIFSIQDVVIKSFSKGYPLFEIMFIRNLSAIIPTMVIAYFDVGFKGIKTKKPWAQILRAFLLFLCYTFYYLGVATLPLADTVALFYTSPFFVMILSMVFLKERIGINRWLCLLICFSGVLVMLNPGAGIFDPAIIFPIIAAITYACAVLVTRAIAGSESASVMGLFVTVFFAVLAGIQGGVLGNGISGLDGNFDFITRAWVFPCGRDFLIIASMGVVFAVGFYFIAEAYRVASASTIAPFEYTGMVPAVFWGICFWNEIPSSTTLAGMGLIVVAGIYLVGLERKN